MYQFLWQTSAWKTKSRVKQKHFFFENKVYLGKALNGYMITPAYENKELRIRFRRLWLPRLARLVPSCFHVFLSLLFQTRSSLRLNSWTFRLGSNAYNCLYQNSVFEIRFPVDQHTLVKFSWWYLWFNWNSMFHNQLVSSSPDTI